MENIKVLDKTEFRTLICFQRLSNKYEILLDRIDINQMLKAFDKMIADLKYENSLYIEMPISNVSFKNMIHEFVLYLKEFNLTESVEDIDEKMVGNLVESCIYTSKMYYYCTLVSGGSNIMAMENWSQKDYAIVKMMYNLGYTTLLDLAMIYSNNNGPAFLPGFGPKRYTQFQKMFWDGNLVKTIIK